jgi:hypothetical protein
MQFPDEQPQLCERCQEQPATAKYTRANISDMLCATCLDRMEVQDAIEDRLQHMDDLERRKQYDEALACLDEILEANRHRDHENGWLEASPCIEPTFSSTQADMWRRSEPAKPGASSDLRTLGIDGFTAV